MTNTRSERKRLFDFLKNSAFVKEHIVEHTRLSGSNTTVYPIQEWIDGINIQWKTNKPCQKWIDDVKKNFDGLIAYGSFWKTDGSCPSVIHFQYHSGVTDEIQLNNEQLHRFVLYKEGQ